MDPCIISGILSIAFRLLASVSCNFRQLKGIVLPKGSGKTFLTSKLDAKQFVVVDIDDLGVLGLSPDELAKYNKAIADNNANSANIIIFPKAKEYIVNLQKQFETKKLLIISSNRDLLKYVGVSASNISVLVPSPEFFKDLMTDKATETNTTDNNFAKDIYTISYNAVSSLKGARTFDSMGELLRVVSKKFIH